MRHLTYVYKYIHTHTYMHAYQARRAGVSHMMRYLRKVNESFATNVLNLTDLNLENVAAVLMRNLNLKEVRI